MSLTKPERAGPIWPPATGKPGLAATAAKRAFYRRPDVVAAYDQQRFGGASGRYVNAREIALVGKLLPAGGLVADVGSGTGRTGRALRERGDHVMGLDTSYDMLWLARASGAGPAAQADAFSLPIRTGACDGAVALRLLFHFEDVAALLREMRRIVHPGGILVCDTYTWSIRALTPLGRRHWGERVSAIAPARFRALAQDAGWRMDAAVPAFLISPYIYRLLPLRLACWLERLEVFVPRRLLCRVFWRLVAA